jgi:hypothetical protein
MVSGRISYFADSGPVPAATVLLQGASGTLATTTDGLGQFVFTGVAAGAWRLEPQKQGDLRDGVSSLDAGYVLQAVSGLRTLDPVAALACDVTGDGTLSALDAALILQFDVGLIDRFPVAQSCGSDWVFVPQPLSAPAQQLIFPQSSDAGCQSGRILFQALQSDVAQQDFAAALIGDCTGNWQSSGSAAALRQRFGSVQARPGRQWLVRHTELEAVRPVGTATDARGIVFPNTPTPTPSPSLSGDPASG